MSGALARVSLIRVAERGQQRAPQAGNRDVVDVIRPSPYRLGRSYKLAPEPVGSPLFTSTPLVACWRCEPRKHLRPLAKTRSLIPPSPLRERVGSYDHDRFRGYVPVHFIPAYNLPVYASQRPLQDTPAQPVQGVQPQDAQANSGQDTRARIRPVQKHQPVRQVRNALSEIRLKQSLRAKVRREQNARVRLRPAQDARTPTFLESLGLQDFGSRD
jgi:hypothetical protein